MINCSHLDRSYDRASFDCGDETVTRFLKQSALQDHERDLSRTTVFFYEDEPNSIIGYHTLLTSHVEQEDIPGDRPRIKREIPVILLGQLGVDIRFQGQGIGDMLLIEAQERIAEISEKVGLRSLALDARNEKLAAWYERREFVRYPGSLRMFKSIDDIRRMFRGK
jgi:GNAT superfamily N-acetyltransferase